MKRKNAAGSMHLHYVIVFVSDMSRAVSFYRDALGVPLAFESPEWSEFENEGATLALHAGDRLAEVGSVAQHARAGQCRPGFRVPDLETFHRRMVDWGVQCIQAPSEVFGERVAQYVGPDGLAISVGERR
jgi:catechol 2,3-dioxygenase-like lactoylglutathione lyase family enzyme